MTEVSTGTLAANNHDKQQILGTPASDRRVHILTAFLQQWETLSTKSGLKALFTLPLGKKQKEHSTEPTNIVKATFINKFSRINWDI